MTVRRLVLAAVLWIGLSGAAHAQTLEWDRNAESDMKDYRIYVCPTAACVVVKSAAMLKATVPQSAAGTAPTWPIPADLLGKPATVAITARDKFLNESALSVQLPFDTTAPAVPGHPRFK